MQADLTKDMLDLQPGDHLCLFYDRDPAEQMPALIPFIQAALAQDERFIYIADDQTVEQLTAHLESSGIPTRQEVERGRLKLWTRNEWRQNGELDSEKKAAQVRGFIEQASADGFKGVRFAVEMTWALGPDISAPKLQRWEATINHLFDRSFAGRIVCQYNRSRLSPETLLAALRTHPMAMVGENVYPNVFYEAPLILRGTSQTAESPNGRDKESAAERVDWMMFQLQRARAAERAREQTLIQHASEQQMRQLMMLMPAGVYTCDAEGRITFFNRRAAEIWGRNPELGEERFCGSLRLWQPNGSPLDRDQTPVAITLRERKSCRNAEVIVERADTSRIIVSLDVDPLQDQAGRPGGAIVVFQDLTELRKAVETRARLAAIIESADDAIISKDLSGIIESWNQGAERVFGYTAEEVIGKSVTILMPADRQHEEVEILARLSRGERIEHFETVRRRKDGSPVNISLTISPIRDDQGRIIGASKIARDITLQKRAGELKARLAAIVESSEDAIIGKDLDGIITSWNTGAEKLYGYSAKEVIGKSICLLNAPGLAVDEPDILARLRRGEKIERYEAVHVAKDGSRVDVSVTVSPIRDDEGRVIGASRIARDISERKRAEAELAAWHHELESRVAKRTEELRRAHECLQAEIEERKRLESEIARAIEREQLRLGQELHDGLGQELTGIVYHLAALRSRLSRAAPAHARDVKKLESIMIRSVEQTKNLARGFYPVDLEVHGLASALRHLASSTKDSFGVSCVVDAGKISSGTLGGPVAIQLFRIAQEAVHNAVKHARAKQILIRLAKTDGNIVLAVQDDGVGLPPNFEEAKGMGLRIMRHRASLIGAKVEYANGPERGAIVTCTVPHDEWLIRFSDAEPDSEADATAAFV